jgi:asparagine synthase (glutamine-hydrolysing)
MVADVPLGAFLSGGIDSSTVVALMQSQSMRPVKTFSIGFHEAGYDEATHARAVARHLGTDHTELYVTPREAQAVIPRLAEMYDEPFADPSQIPTHLVSVLARRHVTVSLSGDGGDELFGGYNRYFIAHPLWRRMGGVPAPLRRQLAAAIQSVPPRTLDGLLGLPLRLVGKGGYAGIAGDKLHRLAEFLPAATADELYRSIVSHWQDPARVVLGATEAETPLTSPAHRVQSPDFRERMMYLDLVTYLPGDILVKLDRASMAVSLEARVPLLDHRVVELAWRVPLELKFRDGGGKWLLRQVLERYVPRTLIDRPKMGFGVPIDSWLRGPLRDWADALLDEARLRREGYLDPVPVRRMWQEHLSGRRNRQYQLWDVLMFQAWAERWMGDGAGGGSAETGQSAAGAAGSVASGVAGAR